MYGKTPDPSTVMRKGLAMHWRSAPVIDGSHDGRSALIRTYLFHPNTGKYDPSSGQPNKAGTIQSGKYPNEQVVLEEGIWRLGTVTIDEPYFVMPIWQGGWSAAKTPPPGGGMRASPLLQRYPPDLLLTDLGKREEGFAGGTGTKIDWPGILPMWFHYRNPVSGRVPPLYWPDCVPCEVRPQVRLTSKGYQMPPTGPAIDGIELKPAATGGIRHEGPLHRSPPGPCRGRYDRAGRGPRARGAVRSRLPVRPRHAICRCAGGPRSRARSRHAERALHRGFAGVEARRRAVEDGHRERHVSRGISRHRKAGRGRACRIARRRGAGALFGAAARRGRQDRRDR